MHQMKWISGEKLQPIKEGRAREIDNTKLYFFWIVFYTSFLHKESFSFVIKSSLIGGEAIMVG